MLQSQPWATVQVGLSVRVLFLLRKRAVYGTGVAGLPCKKTGVNHCEPGLQCSGTKFKGGTCIIGKEGLPCVDGRECKEGFVCGSDKKCAKSAEGQRCLSDFWCPKGMQCSKKSKNCTASIVPPQDRLPFVARSIPCSTSLDYPSAFWINEVCLPRPLGCSCEGGQDFLIWKA